MVDAVIGNYRLVQKLGEGGMGAVYLGQHTLLGRRAAIKVLLPALSARPDIVNRFFNEARAVTSISDPGIVQVFDFGYHTDGSAFIVMEFLEGEPLDKRLARLRRFSVYEALRLGRQIASSLAAAHAQHIIHRDLKPENIFLVRDGEVASGERSKILDFGIAKLSDDHPGKLKTHTGALMGTPTYMSPEQCRGLAEIDHRSDIYSLGCVVFQLLTGRPPFEGEGVGDIISAHIREPAPVPSSLAAGIPANVDALLLRCLAKAPADRYASMGEFAAAIGQILSQVPADAVLSYAPGDDRGAALSVPPTYHSQPPPGHYAQPPPGHALASAAAPPSYVSPSTPTTLSTGTGQLAARSARSPRIGRWIAGVLVLGSVGAGIAILGTRNDGTTRAAATARGTEVIATAEPPGSAAGSATPPAATALGAGGIAQASPPAGTSDVTAVPAAPPSDTLAPDAGTAPAQEVATAPVATHEPAKKPRPRDRPRKTSPASPSRGTAPAASTPPSPRPAPTSSTPATSGASKCSKADFAAVYDAAAPAPGAVRAALRNLKACRDAGAISEAEFDRYQTALVAKL